jgi:hypothetical protein
MAKGMKTRIHAALGKRVNANLYFHVTALEGFDPYIREQVRRAALQASLETNVESMNDSRQIEEKKPRRSK